MHRVISEWGTELKNCIALLFVKRSKVGWLCFLSGAAFFISNRWDEISSFLGKMSRMGTGAKFMVDAIQSPAVQVVLFLIGCLWIGTAAIIASNRQQPVPVMPEVTAAEVEQLHQPHAESSVVPFLTTVEALQNPNEWLIRIGFRNAGPATVHDLKMRLLFWECEFQKRPGLEERTMANPLQQGVSHQAEMEIKTVEGRDAFFVVLFFQHGNSQGVFYYKWKLPELKIVYATSEERTAIESNLSFLRESETWPPISARSEPRMKVSVSKDTEGCVVPDHQGIWYRARLDSIGPGVTGLEASILGIWENGSKVNLYGEYLVASMHRSGQEGQTGAIREGRPEYINLLFAASDGGKLPVLSLKNYPSSVRDKVYFKLNHEYQMEVVLNCDDTHSSLHFKVKLKLKSYDDVEEFQLV
jgi:hypothetical protein